MVQVLRIHAPRTDQVARAELVSTVLGRGKRVHVGMLGTHVMVGIGGSVGYRTIYGAPVDEKEYAQRTTV